MNDKNAVKFGVDPAIRELIRNGGRVIITGSMGAGKSTLAIWLGLKAICPDKDHDKSAFDYVLSNIAFSLSDTYKIIDRHLKSRNASRKLPFLCWDDQLSLVYSEPLLGRHKKAIKTHVKLFTYVGYPEEAEHLRRQAPPDFFTGIFHVNPFLVHIDKDLLAWGREILYSKLENNKIVKRIKLAPPPPLSPTEYESFYHKQRQERRRLLQGSPFAMR